MGDLTEVCAVNVEHKQVKYSFAGGVVVARKNDTLTRRMKIWRPVGPTQIGDLAEVCTVGVYDKYLHCRGLDEALFEERSIILDFLGGLRARSPENDLLAIGREKRPAVVAELVRDLL